MRGGLEVSRRTLLKAFGLAPFSHEPLKALFRELEPIVVDTSVLYYHEISAGSMASELIRLIRQGQQPVSLDTFIGALNGEIVIPKGLKTFLVTCDDGLRSQFIQGRQAMDRVERETGWFVPMTLFALVRFNNLPMNIEDMPDETPCFNDDSHSYMTKGQLIQMIEDGHYVENHTVSHISLARLSPEAKDRDILLAEERIQELWDLTGRKRLYRVFAYPNGAYSGQAEYIQDLGFDAAFSASARISSNHTEATRYFLGRSSRN